MKKLMVIAAVALAAAMSQAATVTWTLSGVKNGDGDSVSGVMYFINNGEFARTSMLALAGGGASAITEALGKTHAFEWTVTDGTGTIKSDQNPPTNAALGLSDTTTYDFYAVVFDTAEITDASNFYVTALKTGVQTAAGTSNKGVALGSQSTASQADGAWKAVGAVPEPTSALLMLLGMAGLALRRRRA